MFTRRRLAVAAGIACALGFAVLAAFAMAARGAPALSTPTSYTDAGGDAGGAADIVAAAVADDYTTGAVVFSVTANGFATIDPAQSPEVDVYVDTDQNSSTGSGSGSEYNLYAAHGSSGIFYGVYRWNGTKWDEAQAPSDFVVARNGDTIVWALNKADMGVTGAAFSFHAEAANFDANGDTTGYDRAPDGGSWTYTLSTAPATTTTAPTPAGAVKPVIGAPTMTGKAVAGKHVTVTFPVTRSDTGEALTSGKMICDPSVQGKVIAHAESFTGGTAKLSFTIPKNAKGKLLKVKVTIKVGSQSATRVANFHVG